MHSTMTFSQHPDPIRDAQFYQGVTARRAFAWGVDTVLILLLSLIAVPVTTVLTLGLGFAFTPLIFIGTAILYRGWSLQAWGATPGMRLFGIEVRDITGRRPDTMIAFWHSAIFVGLTLTGLGWLISSVLILASARGQGLGDLMLGTVVINRPADL